MKTTSLAAAGAFLTTALAEQPVKTSPNRSGVVVSNVGTIVTVTGGLGVPTVNTTGLSPTDTVTGQAAVGLDTQDCPGFLLAGVQWVYSASQGLKYSAFAQWGNGAPVILNLEIGATDYIDLEVNSDGEESGTATVTNASRDIYTTFNFTYEGGRLCHESATWVVIDPSQDGANGGPPYEKFADFEEVDFYYPTYYVQEGDGGVGYALKSDQGEILDMVREGERLATGREESVPNDTNSVTVYYGIGKSE